ncbi:MAG TPA: hypothetical protein VFV84_03815 [Burkholderiales bacterium]|nr:hypothetical protein [Burkholderiales bacterium]
MHGAALILLALAAPAGAFDAGGVALGASEATVQKAFKTAQCRPMEWKTDAADRRCDDATVLGGAEARITFYLRRDRVQAFDVRFGASDVERIAAFLKGRYGEPLADGIEVFDRRGEKRRVRKLRWKQGEDQAVLSAPEGRNRAELNVWRGNFDTEVYNLR